jgi:hypothetical protein
MTSEEDWELGEIEAFVPQIYAATQNKFLPQTLSVKENNELNLIKGCTLNRESVSRSAQMEAQKYQMVRIHLMVSGEKSTASLGIVAGTGIYNSLSTDLPCGTLLRAARRSDIQVDCLAVIAKNVLTSTSLRLGSVNGFRVYVNRT